MLTLRSEQMEVFAEAMRRSFVERSVARLRKQHRALLEEETDADLADLFDRGILRAAEYGIDDEEDVFQFSLRELCWGVDFDRRPELAALNGVFTDPGIEDGDRMGAFLELESKLSSEPKTY